MPTTAATPRPTQRPKLDRRLFRLLEMEPQRRKGLKEHESRLLKEGKAAFSPLSASFHMPPGAGEILSALIVSDASRRDLEELGARVRSQAGDIFTATVPVAALAALEASKAVRYIELARPLIPTLNVAVPRAQIDLLRTGAAHADGAGTIVGVVDYVLDIYHPDFIDAGGQTRVRFLWDQTLTVQGGEKTPAGSVASLPAYGVEYSAADINAQLQAFDMQQQNAYTLVRHNSAGAQGAHGTHVAGIAAGNGTARHAPGAAYIGAAPGADIVFVNVPDLETSGELANIAEVADAFAYIFERAALLNMPCVVNMSQGDNLGPHDGTSAGEQFLDALLDQPGRAITLSAGNSTGTASHATGVVTLATPVTLQLACQAAADKSDALEIWYDGHDRFDTVVTLPGNVVIGPVTAGTDAPPTTLPNGSTVYVSSVLNHPLNGDNCISVTFEVPAGATMPVGTTTIELSGAAVANGAFHAWVDRNNRTDAGVAYVQFTSHVDETSLTLGSPGTARRAITVGNHYTVGNPVQIAPTSGRGPSRDGRVKPEIAAPGTSVHSPWSQSHNQPIVGYYSTFDGTSASAPLVAGACACLFECRGAGTTWAQLKQIFEDTAVSGGPVSPDNAFGFGYVQIATGCARPQAQVDVWLKDNIDDLGAEPYTGLVAWLSPDIEILDLNGNAIANPVYNGNAVTTIVRVTVRNRGSDIARNTEVYLHWADPATFIPYPAEWRTTGICTPGNGGFVKAGNKLVIAQLPPGQVAQVEFGWAPPAPGANLHGDDHFCLLVRVENQVDPSQVGAGGWGVVADRNNIALRNVHVQRLTPAGSALSRFYAVGTGESDSLTVIPAVGGTVQLQLPVQALPWRDRQFIERTPVRREPFTGRPVCDALAEIHVDTDGEHARTLTGIRNAKRLVVDAGLATLTLAGDEPLVVPDLRLARLARAPLAVNVTQAVLRDGVGHVHVAQRSAGRLVGGVTLELRPR